MNADGFRHLYDYHFAINRKVWDSCVVPLTDAQFTQDIAYSVGSIRNQTVHMLNIDERWFCGLRGVEVPGFLDPLHFPTRAVVRERWDAVEADMRAYLEALRDDDLHDPLSEQFPHKVWQVLIHVLNHGTDHRAQMLAMLNQMGVETFPQDYALYLLGRL
jgi:uncharacterized damage-inducible protein DinB